MLPSIINTALIMSLILPTFTGVLNVNDKNQVLLAEHEISLDDRYANQTVNDVFSDNILLTLAYMSKRVTNPASINWSDLEQPYTYTFRIRPTQMIAFHDKVLPEYQNAEMITTNAHFNGAEGFRSDGYLYGDGVCHLASLMNWTAQEARLDVKAPTNHNFANIPDIPEKYGTSIYTTPGETLASAQQNLYITNNLDHPIIFEFHYDGHILHLSIYEEN